MKNLLESEGDINISARRDQWQKDNIDAQTRALLEEDTRFYLKQYHNTKDGMPIDYSTCPVPESTK